MSPNVPVTASGGPVCSETADAEVIDTILKMSSGMGMAQHTRHKKKQSELAKKAVLYQRKLDGIAAHPMTRKLSRQWEKATPKRKAPPTTTQRKPKKKRLSIEEVKKYMDDNSDQNGNWINNETAREYTGYSKSALNYHRQLWEQGVKPSATRGRRKRVSETVQEQMICIGIAKTGTTEWMNEMNKASLLEHQLKVVRCPKDRKEWTPISERTLRRYDKECRLVDQKAQIETPARLHATTDWRTYLTLFAALRAADKLYGSVSIVHAMSNDEKTAAIKTLNPLHTFNFDASTGTTFNVSFKVKNKKGAPAVKVQIKNSTLKQQYNVYYCVNAAGQQVPPLIGIRGKHNAKLKVQAGKPIFIPLKDPLIHANIGALGQLGIPPYIVIYHKDDKKNLAKYFIEKILDPILDVLAESLEDGESHVALMDGVGEHLKHLESEELQKQLMQQRRQYIKLAANATSTTQVAILYTHAHAHGCSVL